MMTPNEFFDIVEQMPLPAPVFYRLYHDQTGVPLFYTMEDLPGTYIEITQQQYANSQTNVRVRDGKIIPVTWQITQKVTPSDTGTLCHVQDVSVVVDQNGTYWSKQTYESN
jgi:hypothetical protein